MVQHPKRGETIFSRVEYAGSPRSLGALILVVMWLRLCGYMWWQMAWNQWWVVVAMPSARNVQVDVR